MILVRTFLIKKKIRSKIFVILINTHFPSKSVTSKNVCPNGHKFQIISNDRNMILIGFNNNNN